MTFVAIQGQMAEVYKSLQDIAVKLKTAEAQLTDTKNHFDAAEAAVAEKRSSLVTVIGADVVELGSYKEARAEHAMSCAQRDGMREALGKATIVVATMKRMKLAIVAQYNTLTTALKTAGAAVLPFAAQE